MSDEASCDSDYLCQGFYCLSGRCIPLRKHLDFISDCELGEDELIYNENQSMLYDLTMNPECFVDNTGYAHISCRLFSHDQFAPCFRYNDMCILQPFETGESVSCSNAAQLTQCLYFRCSGMFKCPHSYCIPFQWVCDGKVHCEKGDDEVGCSKIPCPGMLKCPRENVCVPQSYICDGIPQCHLSQDDESTCHCPKGCECKGVALQCSYQEFTQSKLSHTFHFTLLTLVHVNRSLDVQGLDVFDKIAYLRVNNVLDANVIISPEKKWNHNNLKFLILKNNKLQLVLSNTFYGLSNLRILDLSDNGISHIPTRIFTPLEQLRILLLQNNRLYKLEAGHLSTLTRIISWISEVMIWYS